MPERQEHSRNFTPDWWQAGIANVDAGEYREALICFDRCLLSDESAVGCWSMKAICFQRLGQGEEAHECLSEYLSRAPDDHIKWRFAGDFYAAFGQPQTALDCYDYAVEDSAGTDASVWAQRGIVLADLGEHSEAITSYERAIELNPEYSVAWMNKGVSLSILGCFEDALDCYERSLSIEPNCALTWKNIGVALRKLKRYKEVVLACEIGLEYEPDYVDLLGDRALALLKLRKYDEALQSVTRALQLKPDKAGYWGWCASALLGVGEYDLALSAIGAAIEINPDASYFWKEKGFCLVRLNRFQEANACFAVADELWHEDTE